MSQGTANPQRAAAVPPQAAALREQNRRQGRLPAQVRERRPALAVLAALLILAGGLGGMVTYQQAGEKVDAVKVVQRVAPGQGIPASAIEPVRVSKDTDVAYVPWEQRNLLNTKYFAATDIPAGTLLTGSMLTAKGGVAGDQAIVGLSVKTGSYPPGLRAGDRVRVLWVGKDAAKAGAPGTGTGGAAGAAGANEGVVLADSATVREVFKSSGSGNSGLSLSVTVPANRSGGVAQASSFGEVALVLLPAEQK
ncbi:hypothetical protein ACFY00_25105 [Kitasatospora sp. NPDC001540]|uniref:hypothetical protein n=1 Tax=Kitasatospora sp. NPDC001540 TaxID=3364014 RepID=UPI0036C9E00D